MKNDPNQERDQRFNSEQAAIAYPNTFNLEGYSINAKRRYRRELALLDKAFSHFKPDSKILDLPCGTGRLSVLLADAGMRVTAADLSPKMVDSARETMGEFNEKNPSQAVEFATANAMETNFADDQFDGVLCYRLLHHFHEAGQRRQIFKELRRINTGPIVATVFTSNALDYYVMRFRSLFTGKKHLHRSYLPLKTFHEDFAAAGLTVVEAIPRMRGISPVWIFVLK